ncbi:CbrC family protein [Streptomyces glomeratus]|uniref:CbrC family protein n=1 Tax=Streptomyces glomeratus TaxID=284452 RepID=A0ABP6M4I7_9ACTN|nr:CbrC family protein [Streptomyces glomeratus]MCF1506385.1 CbrC family protein [Streptomyces glomeratus]
MSDPATTAELPSFPYHPDPLATGSVVAADTECLCCGLRRGYVYVGPVYAVADVRAELCPWCIADGSAAERFGAQFTEVTGEAPKSVVRTVERCTPGFSGWQQERWLTHCGDAAEYLGRAGAKELADHPEAAQSLRETLGETFFASLDADGQPTAYLFRCRSCAQHVAYADFT